MLRLPELWNSNEPHDGEYQELTAIRHAYYLDVSLCTSYKPRIGLYVRQPPYGEDLAL